MVRAGLALAALLLVVVGWIAVGPYRWFSRELESQEAQGSVLLVRNQVTSTFAPWTWLWPTSDWMVLIRPESIELSGPYVKAEILRLERVRSPLALGAHKREELSLTADCAEFRYDLKPLGSQQTMKWRPLPGGWRPVICGR